MTHDGNYQVDAEGVAADEQRSLDERIESVEAEIKDRNGDKSEIYKEVKGRGFDVKAIKRIVQLRRQDASERQEMDAVLDLYMTALGMA